VGDATQLLTAVIPKRRSAATPESRIRLSTSLEGPASQSSTKVHFALFWIPGSRLRRAPE